MPFVDSAVLPYKGNPTFRLNGAAKDLDHVIQ